MQSTLQANVAQLESALKEGEQLTEVLSKSEELLDTMGSADKAYVPLCLIKAHSLSCLGHFQDSEHFLENIIYGAVRISDPILKGRLLTVRAFNEQHIGNRFHALKYYYDAVNLFRTNGDFDRAAVALANISSLLVESSDYLGALEFRREALRLIEGSQKIGFRVSLLISNIYDYLNLDELDQVAATVDLIEKIIDLSAIPRTDYMPYLIAKGSYLIRCERFGEASEILHQARSLNAGDSSVFLDAQIKACQGEVASKQGLNVEAAALLDEALELYEANGMHLGMAEVWKKKADHEMHLGNVDTAMDLYQLAHDCCVDKEYYELLVSIYPGLIECAKRRGNLEDAIRLLEEQRELRDRSINRRSKFQVLRQSHQVELVELRHQEELARTKASVLKDKNEELKESNQRLMQVDLERKEFMSILAHDIRSPLASIISCIRYMELGDEKDQDNGLRLLSNLKVRTLGALELAENILELERMEEEEDAVQCLDVDLSLLVEQLKTLFHERLEEKGQQLDIEMEAGLFSLSSDRIKLMQILGNLLSNAIKYGPRGGRIELGIRSDKDDIVFEVEDEGPGIVISEGSRLFEKFAEMGNMPTGGESPHGLGLYIVKRYTEMLGGSIRYHHRESQGARFELRLPSRPQS